MAEEKISYKIGSMLIELTKEDVQKNCCNGVVITDAEYARFASLCQQNGLNPYAQEAKIIAKEGYATKILIGKDGYFRMADSNPDYDGMEDGVIVKDKEGNIQEMPGCFVPEGAELIGGWAKVYSKKRTYPKYVRVSLSEYNGSEKTLWATKPATMINKVAKCSALRDMFPQMFSGTYDESEYEKVTNSKENVNDAKQISLKEEVENKSKTISLEEALKYELKESGKASGYTIQSFVDSEKADPAKLLDKIVKAANADSPYAKIVLDAIKENKIEVKFKGK